MASNVSPARLRTSRRTELDVEAVRQLLGPGGPDGWLGVSVSGGPSDMRRYAADLRIGQPQNRLRAAIRKSAYVDVGPVELAENAVRAEISWRSASLAPLFPVFSGWLTVHPKEIVIDGRYVPPGGPLGFVADRALMHRAARYTADWLLHELDRAAQTTSVEPPSLT